MPEWVSMPDVPDWDAEKRVSIERYEYAAAALAGDGAPVLDCACGMGYGTEILAETCGAIGIDIDPAAIEEAQLRYPHLGFLAADIYKIPMQDFRALVCFETLEHLDRPEGVVTGLSQSIKQIVASVPIRPSVHCNPWHRRDFTADSFRALIESGGFRIVAEHPQAWSDGKDMYLILHGVRTQ